MKYPKLKKIKKLYFGNEDISRILGITPESAWVSAARYVKQGFLVRIKRNLYVLRERWDTLENEEKFMLANLAQVPSYISLMTAMAYYGITTQIQRDFVESIALKWTKEIKIGDSVFNYSKINKKLYFGFVKTKGFFIATPEKAFLDALYLGSLKRYSFDLSSVDFDKMNASKLKKIAGKFPVKTRGLLKEIYD